MNTLNYIIALPLLTSLLVLVLLYVLPKRANAISPFVCNASVLVSCLLSLTLFNRVMVNHEIITLEIGSWIGLDDLKVNFTFVLDKLSYCLTLLILGVGSMVHVFSLGYMHDDESKARYFSLLNLFCFMMLVLVLASSLPLLFIGWEGVGLTSYLLIGFWYDNLNNAKAGLKAFVVNRIGDAGLLLGMFFIHYIYKTLDFNMIEIQMRQMQAYVPLDWLNWIGLLLFVGCIGKSAQLPLYIWLPQAMAGPTPVSALIHAATMVTAGVYLMARMSFLFSGLTFTLDVIAWVGTITALFSGLVALKQDDIKKVLAFSTVSQLGFMVLACAVGAYWAGVFHLMTHAFFKALLFLSSGAIIYVLHHEQNILKMGGLKTFVPFLTLAFIAGFLAIIGFPFTSGFYSKDAILISVFLKSKPLFFVALLAALLTAVYMTRLFVMVFVRPTQVKHEVLSHLHMPGLSMKIPLIVLSVFSLVSAWPVLGLEHVLLEYFHATPVHSVKLMLLITGLSLVSCFFAYRYYLRSDETLTSPLNTFLKHEMKINEGLMFLGRWFLEVLKYVCEVFDRVVLQNTIERLVSKATGLGQFVVYISTGYVQMYVVVMTVFAIAAFVYVVWMGGV